MLKAKLIPTGISTDITVQAFRKTIDLGRDTVAAERAKSRHKALQYSRFARERAFKKGYHAGLATAQQECLDAIKALRNCYEEVLRTASEDTRALAKSIAEKIIDTTLTTRPETLIAWIEEGLSFLKESRDLCISINPRYSALLDKISAQLNHGVSIKIDSNFSDKDFTIDSSRGGVEFSWRDTVNGPHDPTMLETRPC